MAARRPGKPSYTISTVAQRYGIHPQTLRLYEREGLLAPSRTDGNTRMYSDEDLERLETILSFTRDLGVNLAGVEIILNMRARMEAMQRQMEEFISTLNRELAHRVPHTGDEPANSLVPVLRMPEVALSRPAAEPKPSKPARGRLKRS